MRKQRGRAILAPENPIFKPLFFTPGMELEIFSGWPSNCIATGSGDVERIFSPTREPCHKLSLF
jgi:hypothetical protein